ncbi:MAG: phosphatase [Roseivirga sp.]|nr:phosphatase [Roseivirga sp.]
MKLKADAIVSPANSFGDMGGGIDKAIDDFYKGKAQKNAIENIRRDFLGELPVGSAIILRMDNRRLAHLIVAPTMRIPGNVSGTINAYLAMRAILVAVFKHNERTPPKIQHIVVPSLCTGVGRMPFVQSAHQMLKAYQNIILGQWKDVIHPSVAPFVMKKQNID